MDNENRTTDVDVCVLLATYRRPDLLEQTLGSLARQDLPGLSMEVIVVDNAGDEATKQVIDTSSQRLRLRGLVETRRRGKSGAVNAGLDALPRCQLLVLTDDDIVARPDWIAELWAAADRWPDADVFGGLILPRFPADTAGIDVSNPWVLAALSVANESGLERPVAADKVWGTNLAVRARALASGLRFDEKLGPTQGDYTTGNEIDFTRRLAEAGAVCVFVPSAIVEHAVRKEQLNKEWLCQRWYRYGRGKAVQTPASGQHPWRGVPRWIYRRRVAWLMQYWLHRLAGNEHKMLESRMRNEFMRGQFSVYREKEIARSLRQAEHRRP